MITLAQRITELRTQKGMSRPELSLALGLPKTAVEKFETGRQTPTQEQQKKMATYFGVSLFYLRGESPRRAGGGARPAPPGSGPPASCKGRLHAGPHFEKRRVPPGRP